MIKMNPIQGLMIAFIALVKFPVTSAALEASVCPKNLKTRTTAINIIFDQGRVNDAFTRLPYLTKNQHQYAAMARSWSAKSFTLGEEHAFRRMLTKDEILKAISQKVKSAEYVNFNYAGHAVRLADGEWAIPLPTLPPALLRKCGVLFQTSATTTVAKQAARTARGCEAMDEYLIRGSELRRLFQGKKVFGINDSCFSAGLDLGPDAIILNSARDHEVSEDQLGLASWVEFTQGPRCRAKETRPANFRDLAHRLQAGKDRPLLDLIRAECDRTPDQICPKAGAIVQHPVLRGDSNRPWLSCFGMPKFAGDKLSCDHLRKSGAEDAIQ